MFSGASKNPLTQLLVQKSGSYELNSSEQLGDSKKSVSSIELSDIVAGYDVGQFRSFGALTNNANVSSYLSTTTTTTRTRMGTGTGTTTNSGANIIVSSSNGSIRSGSQRKEERTSSAKQQIAKLIQQTSSKLSRAQSSISLSSNSYYLNNNNNNSNSNDNNSNNTKNHSQPSFKLQQPQKVSFSYNDNKDNNNNDNNNHDFCSISNHNYIDNQIQDGVTLCTLGVGTTFGASVIPGKSHSVSVVTSDDCTLLRVRRADFQEIFNEQSHLINNVESSPFCSFTSLNRFTASNAVSKRGSTRNSASASTRSSADGGGSPIDSTTTALQTPVSKQPLIDSKNEHLKQQQQQHRRDDQLSHDNEPEQQQQQEDGELADFNLDSIDSNELSSHLMRIGWVLRTLMLDQCPHLIQNRRIYPHQLHKHHAHHSHKSTTRLSSNSSSSIAGGASNPAPVAEKNPGKQKHLVSMASSSQLLAGSSTLNTATSASSSSSSTKSAASAAGRKVANYVASSFMRANSKATAAAAAAVALAASNSQQQQQTAANSKPTFGSHALFISSSFDAASGSQINAQANNLHQHCNLPGGSNHQTGLEKVETITTTTTTKEEPIIFRRSMLGREMVDWLVNLGQAAHTNASRFVTSRLQAISMWQVLLEQGIVFSYTSAQANTIGSDNSVHDKTSSANSQQQRQNCCQFQFCDDQHAYYKFWFDRDGTKQQQQACDEVTSSDHITSTRPPTTTSPETINQDLLPRPSESDLVMANESLWWSLKVLSKIAPDACFRLILSKLPHERSSEEVDIVYEELQHLKALSHLTNSVKKELAACVTSEYHAKQNTVIFNQGDVGQSWYIILRGSVNVVIVGKGVVCTLHDGDDFGKLALVNDAPRAATIVTNESNCYFLRVDKHNFNTILRDVEANTVRLKEHGKLISKIIRIQQHK